MSLRQSEVSDLFSSSDSQASIVVPLSNPTLKSSSPSSQALGSNELHPIPFPLPFEFSQSSNLSSSVKSSSSIYRHHRHQSNASETSSSSPFPDRVPPEHSTQLSVSPAPSFDDMPTTSPFVDEPLPMEGDFATMDLHSSPNIIHSFLPRPPSTALNDSKPFRYDTLTWAKEHHFPEPQDTILATGGLHPKTSISSLTAMLESQQHPIGPFNSSFQSTHFSNHHSIPPNPSHNYSSPNLDQLASRHTPDPSISSISQSNSARPDPSSMDPLSSVPIITLPTLASNPNSPLPRLDMNHPAMPTGPSISLTSATPLTAKPGEQLSDFFQSINHPSLPGPDGDPQNLPPSSSHSFFGSLISQNQSSSIQTSNNQQTSFLNPRPLRGRQRSKSESMGKQYSIHPEFDPLTKSLFSNPTTCPLPVTDFSPTSLCPKTPSTASVSYLHPHQLSSEIWPCPQNNRQFTSSSQMCLLEGQSPIFPQISDTSFLQGLLDELDHKRRAGGPDYDSSFLKPPLHPNHRRSHSVSHVHRRGRSEGQIGTGTGPSLSDQPLLDHLIPTPNLSSSPCSRPFQPSSYVLANQSLVGSQQNVTLVNSDWLTSFSIDEPSVTCNPNGQGPQSIYSPSPSDPCLSSRPRSYSHSSFESGDTGGSAPPMATPIEYRSRTTAATKAAAVKRRKEGVAARYVCEMCGETFTRRYNLRGHQRAHKGEKPFACGFPGCTSRFARAHDQKRHYKLHLGVKDYNCPVCLKTFIRLDALQRHHKSDAGQACFHQLQMTGRLSQDYGLASNDDSNNCYTSGSGGGGSNGLTTNPSCQESIASSPLIPKLDSIVIQEGLGGHNDISYPSQLSQPSQPANGNKMSSSKDQIPHSLDQPHLENFAISDNDDLFAQLNNQSLNPQQSLQFLSPHHHEL